MRVIVAGGDFGFSRGSRDSRFSRNSRGSGFSGDSGFSLGIVFFCLGFIGGLACFLVVIDNFAQGLGRCAYGIAGQLGYIVTFHQV